MSTPEQIAFKKLVEKYLDGTASAQEAEIVAAYYQLFAEAPNALDQIDIAAQDQLEVHLRARVSQKIKSFEKPVVPLYHKWKKAAVAAAAIAAITLGVWIYYPSSLSTPSSRTEGRDLSINNIAPGKNTATLTLADGKVINLDTSRSSVVVADSVKAMTMLTAATPRGGTYQVVLPDGTNVWLNAASKISFPSQFDGKERKILLTGEAYFEVAKDKTRPFVVSTDNQDVTVLGTHFNVSSYGDEINTKTTLLEGSVRVSSSRQSAAKRDLSSDGKNLSYGRDDVVLKPNEQAVLIPSGQIKVTEVDTDEAIAWKNGLFSYTSAPLDVVLKQVSRWYNVEVEYLNETSKSQTFTGSVSRYDNVSRLLKAIEYTGAVKFKIEGNKIIVTN